MSETSQNDDALQRAVEHGVDLSLLVERLQLTPTERVLRHQAALQSILALRQAGEESRSAARVSRRRAQ